MFKRFFNSTGGRGVSWTMFGFALSYAIRLLSTLFLTRLLEPEVFGLMSLAWVFLMALAMISDIGTVPSVVRSARGDEKEFLDTAWSIQAVRGFWIGVAVLVLAWPLSWLYAEPALFPILCALAINPFLHGLTSIAIATCHRHTRLGRLTLMELTTQILTVVLNVLFAWWLQSVWALVIGALLGSMFNLAASYVFLPTYRPRLHFNKDVMAEIVTFGRWILLGTLFTYFGGQGSTAIMGFYVPVDVLGLITIATTIAWACGELVSRILGQVAFPALSRTVREGGDLGPVVSRLKKMIFFLVLPVFIVVSLLGQQIIDLLYDARYAQAGTFLTFLALNGALGVLSMPYQNAMMAIGNSRQHSFVMGLHAIGTVILMLIGAQLMGAVGMIFGMGASQIVVYCASAWLGKEYSRYGIKYDAAHVAIVAAFYVYGFVSM